MNIKQYIKLDTVIPIVSGIIIGSILFFWGEIDDAPGLSLIAVVLCVGLMYLGIRNINKINKHIKPGIVLPLFYGTIGIICILQYFIDEISDEPPGLILIGIVGCITLMSIGIIKIKKQFKNKKTED